MNLINLNPSEQLIAIFRKHPLFIWLAAIKYIVLAALPAIVLPFMNNSMNVSLNGYGSVLYFSFLILLWIGFFIEWTDFMLDTWILTDERLIDVEQVSLFNRRVSTLSLDRVQDITTTEAGFLETLLGIGIVIVQTAGESQEFKVSGVKDPNHVKDLIQHAYRQGRQDILHEIANLRS
jgi:uncharacterized membrane protein YdbT with pleckstrin-like domain